MDDHGDAHGDHDDDHDHPEPDGPVRVTAPQQEYTGRQVGIGFLVGIVGMLLTLAVPILLV